MTAIVPNYALLENLASSFIGRTDEGIRTFSKLMFPEWGYRCMGDTIEEHREELAGRISTVGRDLLLLIAVGGVVGMTTIGAGFVVYGIGIMVLFGALSIPTAQELVHLVEVQKFSIQVQADLIANNSLSLSQKLLATHPFVLQRAWSYGVVDQDILNLARETFNEIGDLWVDYLNHPNEENALTDFNILHETEVSSLRRHIAERLATLRVESQPPV